MNRTLPTPSPWSIPFWEGVNEGKLRYQFCTEAQRPVMYPKRLSPFTLKDTLEWRESAGLGTVYSFTVQRIGAPSGFEGELPYVIAIVQLDEGFQMMSNIITDDYENIECGDRVRVDFVTLKGQDNKLPVFTLEREA